MREFEDLLSGINGIPIEGRLHKILAKDPMVRFGLLLLLSAELAF
jgi:hypothetical protein